MARHLPQPRLGAVSVEMALVYSITFMLIILLVIVGFGVSRFQQVASLAREASRWASVHGGLYERETGNPAAAPSDVYQNVIAAEAVQLDLSQLTYQVTWDDAGKMPSYTDANGKVKTNRVRVTITYQWAPEAFLGGVSMTSTSEVEMAY